MSTNRRSICLAGSSLVCEMEIISLFTSLPHHPPCSAPVHCPSMLTPLFKAQEAQWTGAGRGVSLGLMAHEWGGACRQKRGGPAPRFSLYLKGSQGCVCMWCVWCVCVCVRRACAAALCVTCIYEYARVPCVFLHICVSLYMCLYACGIFMWPSGLDCIPGVPS